VRYAAARLAQAVPLLFLVSVAGFSLMHLAPGGPTIAYAHNPLVSGAQIASIRRGMGLDDPLPQQYLKWLVSLLRGDWGYSFVDGRSVQVVILERVPSTLLLMTTALAIALALALPLGILAAARRNSILDHVLTVASSVAWAMPVFWLGLLAQFALAVRLRLLPVAGLHSTDDAGMLDLLRHLLLPALVLGLGSIAAWSRLLRSALLEALSQPYVTAARAKGGSRRGVLLRHALRNALSPLVTMMGLDIPQLFAGAVMTETVFAWPGMGRLFYDSLMARDYPVEMGILMITAVLIIAGNLAADIACGALDPRVRLGVAG